MDNEKNMSAVNEEPEFSSKFAQFEHWLTNVFWFHYRWYFIAGVFALTVLLMLLISSLSKVSYDWTVIYAHSGTADKAVCDKLEDIFEAALPETGKNRRVNVKIIDLSYDENETMAEYGEYRLYSYLNNQDSMIFVIDNDFLNLFSSLGYFEDASELSGCAGLYCAVNDSPVLPLSAEDSRYSDYSQEFLDEVYIEFQNEHENLLAMARSALKGICQ